MSSENRRSAGYALAILTFINMFNYVDRWVMAALVEPIRKDLGLTDTQLGLVATGFIIVYSVTSPVFGRMGDRKARPPLIAIGCAIWSVATGLAGFAHGFWSLFVTRSTVGVGEAAYGTIAPALLADHTPMERRGRVMSIFFAAIPIGSAAGFVLGGLANQYFGWRAAFWLVGFPGLLLSLLVLGVFDPPRGRYDDAHVPHESGTSLFATYRDLFRNVPYVLSVLGYAAYTFALGGIAFWMPAFLERARGLSNREASVTFGSIVLFTGFAGTFLGGFLGDFFLRRTRQSYLWISGIGTLLAVPLTYVGLTNPNKPVYLTALIFAEILIFMCTGPINTAIINCVAPAERATAVGLSVLAMHVLGDMPATPIIGAVSDSTSLAKAMLLAPVAIAIAGLIWIWAAWRGEK